MNEDPRTLSDAELVSRCQEKGLIRFVKPLYGMPNLAQMVDCKLWLPSMVWLMSYAQ